MRHLQQIAGRERNAVSGAERQKAVKYAFGMADWNGTGIALALRMGGAGQRPDSQYG